MPSVDAVVTELSRRGAAVSAAELARHFGVTPMTVTRLLSAAGERVCRMGRTRGTRYAATRALPGVGLRIPVHAVTEHGTPEPVGAWVPLAGGGTWWERAPGDGTLFAGLPAAAWDMSPQGFLGRSFTVRHPHLSLPERLTTWTDDHRLIALARRGEDCVGNLIAGRESLDRWLAHTPERVSEDAYPQLATGAAQTDAGSSAGGERPKFLAYTERGHVLVKYVGGDGASAQRWRDLLVCEALALEAVRRAGLEAAAARWFDLGRFRFLEVQRFDRVGARGRRGVLSLAALDGVYVGEGTSWTRSAAGLRAQGRIDEGAERAVRWLDVFGQLTANDDRHLGNLAFFGDAEATPLTLAPVYDMLPMRLAPTDTEVVERPFTPQPPSSDTLPVWSDAAQHASAYWEQVAACPDVSDDVRRRAEAYGQAVVQLRRSRGL